MIQNNESVISEEMIFLDLNLKDKNSIIDFISDKAFRNNLIEDKNRFIQSVCDREEQVSTAIGYSIAIPHGKSSVVEKPFISVLRLANEIVWSDQNEELVSLVFLIGVPEKNENNIHLKFISELSKKLLDDSFREKLLTEKNMDTIFKQLKSINI